MENAANIIKEEEKPQQELIKKLKEIPKNTVSSATIKFNKNQYS